MLNAFTKTRLLGQAVLAVSAFLVAGPMAPAHASSAPLYNELPETIKKAGKIHVAADKLPPYRISSEDGRKVEGLEVELIQALEKQLGVPFETSIVANGPAIFTGIDTGRYDISFGPALATAEREKRYDIIPWLLSKPAFVLPAQHGLKTKSLMDLCGRRISVMTGSAAIREIEIMDGLCEKAGQKKVQQVVMPDQNATPRAQAILQALQSAGFDVEPSEQIQKDIWYKLWGNMTVNPISGLTGATGDRILDDAYVRQFMSRCMHEAAEIGRRIGITIDQDPEDRHQVTRQLGAFRTSMLQDVQAGKAIELDALVGAVLDIARQVHVAAPNIETLMGLSRLHARTLGLYPA